MRWPFFFGRSSAVNRSGAPEPRPAIRDWASLPAIQRAFGEVQLTAPTAAFVTSLAGMHDPDLSLEPLGHHVSLDGPSGLVSGLARTVETYAPSHELVARPRPRRDAPVQRSIFPSDEGGEMTSAAEDVIDLAASVPPPVMSFPVIDQPVRTRTPLTSLSDRQATAVMGLAMPRPAAASTAGPAFEAAGVQAGPEIGPQPVTAQRLTLGQARRLGLGAPIPKTVAPSVQRSVDAPPLDLAPVARRPREEHVDAASETVLPVGEEAGDATSTVSFERVAPLAGNMIQRLTTTEAGDVEQPGELPAVRSVVTDAVETAGAPERAIVQRVMATPLPPLFQRPAPLATAPIVPDRPRLLTVGGPSETVDVGAGTVEPAMVQRMPVASLGEGPAPALQLDLMPSRTPVAYREVVAAATPSRRTMPVLIPPAPTVQRAVTGVHDFVAYSPFATPPAGQPARRAIALTDFPVQREPAAGEAPTPEPSAAAAPVAAAASAGAAAAEAPGQSEKELDELARKLHDRISLHLRRDLLIQRERAGLVTDLR